MKRYALALLFFVSCGAPPDLEPGDAGGAVGGVEGGGPGLAVDAGEPVGGADAGDAGEPVGGADAGDAGEPIGGADAGDAGGFVGGSDAGDAGEPVGGADSGVSPGLDAGTDGGSADAGLPDAGEQVVTFPSFTFSAEYRSNPADSSGIRVCDYPAGTNCLTDADGKSKGRMRVHDSGLTPGAALHRLSFEFQSNGYVTQNPSAHFAVGLRGLITRDAAGDPIAVNGRGFILGAMGGDPRNHGNPSCASRMIEIESYFGDRYLANPADDGNTIFSQTCSDSLIEEGRWYRMELFVSLDRKIGYQVFDEQGHLLQSLLFQDPTNYLDPSLTEVFFGHVFDTPVASPGQAWSLSVRGMELRQSAEPIESHFGDPLMRFFRGATPLPEGSTVAFADLSLPGGVSAGDFHPTRRRIFGCANPAPVVGPSVVCGQMADYRAIDFSGDGSFELVGTRLSLIPSAYASYPPNTYLMYLRTNPESALVQASVQILK